MSQSVCPVTVASRAAISALFSNKPPVLIEGRFPSCADPPDWHLCEDAEQLDKIFERPSPDAEVHANSIWDLKNAEGALCLRR